MGTQLNDPAVLSGLLALTSLGAALYFLRGVRKVAAPDFWESVAWGKIFVGMVYVSVAMLALLAFFHSADRACSARPLGGNGEQASRLTAKVTHGHRSGRVAAFPAAPASRPGCTISACG